MRLLLVITCLSLSTLLRAADMLWLISPGKQMYATLYLDNGKLMYRVGATNQVLIEKATLGIRVDNRTIGTATEEIHLLRQYENQTFRPSRINSRTTIDRYIGYYIAVVQKGVIDTLHFRLYDNGCAFRYIPSGDKHTLVNEELTTFTLPDSSRVWYFERDNNWKLKSYAGLWMSTTPQQLPGISKQGPIQGKPLVVELPGKKYMVLTEAALYNYTGIRFKAIGNNTLQANYTEGETGVTVNAKLITPWRVILYANHLNELVNNKVIECLNPVPDITYFSDKTYIKPGIAVWSWISRNEHYMEPAEEIKFIDAAAKLKFNYTLIDEGWETKWPQKWEQLKALCKYAAKKKIGVWVWKHSKDIMDTVQRNAFLDSIRACGVAGIKTDFMNSEAKDLIDFEIGLLAATAKRKLMVNFHGCQAPTGESTTWPNEMTREGIRGMELNIMNEPIPAWHNAALPFTRFLCGHGDYTPGFFTNKANTTYTHQLALLYLFNSPFQCIAENPVTLLSDATYKPILPLLKKLPVTWDETVVLVGSEIGKLAAFARRKGKDWYVAVINGTDSTIPFSINPWFLRSRKPRKAKVFADAAGNTGFTVTKKELELGHPQNFDIPANGGIVIQIKSE